MKRKLFAASFCALLLITTAGLLILAVGAEPQTGPTADIKINAGANGGYTTAVEIYFPKGTEEADKDSRYDASTAVRLKIEDSFQLSNSNPNGVTLQTATRGEGGLFGAPQTADSSIMKAVDADSKKIEVTGFDFGVNTKLIITYTIKPITGFLGGANVPFLTFGRDKSGYFGNLGADYFAPLAEGDQKVNVPVPRIVVDPINKNVYAGVPVSDGALKSGARACVEGDESNILDWSDSDPRRKYVTVDKKIYYPDAGDPSKGTDAPPDPIRFSKDAVYVFNVKVAPKTPSNFVREGGGSNSVNVFVRKPKIKFEDLTVYYGAEVNLSSAYKSVEWEDGNSLAVNISDDEPAINSSKFVFTEADGSTHTGTPYYANKPKDYYIKVEKYEDGDTDTLINAADMIFEHVDDNSHEFNPANGQFMLHIQTCTLTVNKTFASGPRQAGGESFVFDITNNNASVPVKITAVAHTTQSSHSEASVVVNGLPVGTYTVVEDKLWSWRYNAGSGTATLSATNSSGQVNIINSIDPEKTKWLTYETYKENRWQDDGSISIVTPVTP